MRARVVVLGLAFAVALATVAAARTGAGSLDPSFGSNGKVTTGFGPGSYAYASAAALQSNGKIVAAGYAGDAFALARYKGGR
jgi:hypothetical protein